MTPTPWAKIFLPRNLLEEDDGSGQIVVSYDRIRAAVDIISSR